MAECNSLKVLISGAYATGKTTLTERLRDQLCSLGVSVVVVGEVPRSCPFPLNREQDAFTSCWLLGEQIKQEAAAQRSGASVVICDRGAPDFVAHPLAVRPSSIVEQGLLEAFWGIAENWSRTYGLVFWALLDPEAAIPEDSIRVAEKTYQVEMEECACAAFERLSLQPIVLPSATDDRVVLALATVRRALDGQEGTKVAAVE